MLALIAALRADGDVAVELTALEGSEASSPRNASQTGKQWPITAATFILV